MRACKFLSRIDKKGSRCGAKENEVHLFFLCPFSKDDWFYSPWYLRSDFFATSSHSIPAVMQTILSYRHQIIFKSKESL
jgi:hypothetical protein